MARETYLHAWAAALFAGRLGSGASVVDVSPAVSAIPRRASPLSPSNLLLDGLSVLMTQGRAAAAPTLELAVGAFASDEISTDEGLRWGWLATAVAVVLWDYDVWRAILGRDLSLWLFCGHFLGQLHAGLSQAGGVHAKSVVRTRSVLSRTTAAPT